MNEMDDDDSPSMEKFKQQFREIWEYDVALYQDSLNRSTDEEEREEYQRDINTRLDNLKNIDEFVKTWYDRDPIKEALHRKQQWMTSHAKMYQSEFDNHWRKRVMRLCKWTKMTTPTPDSVQCHCCDHYFPKECDEYSVGDCCAGECFFDDKKEQWLIQCGYGSVALDTNTLVVMNPGKVLGEQLTRTSKFLFCDECLVSYLDQSLVQFIYLNGVGWLLPDEPLARVNY
jgi:hypothetical protein